jgi:hypothetical protein
MHSHSQKQPINGDEQCSKIRRTLIWLSDSLVFLFLIFVWLLRRRATRKDRLQTVVMDTGNPALWKSGSARVRGAQAS